MTKMVKVIIQELLYLIDPFFRNAVQRKVGPDDRIGSRETTIAVVRFSNGSQRVVRRRR